MVCGACERGKHVYCHPVGEPCRCARELGAVAYAAYAQSTGGRTFDGRDMPTWEQIAERTPHVARAWEAAAAAVVQAAT